MRLKKYITCCLIAIMLQPMSAQAAVVSGERPLGGVSKIFADHPPEDLYTDHDLYLLSRVIYREVGNSTRESMIACGSVVLNRVADPDYPDTIEMVLYQVNPVQYSTIWSDNFAADPSQSCKDVAVYLLITGGRIPQNVVYQSTFKQGSGVYKRIGEEVYSFK